jgi:Fur family zinc uptake transcriptional regulator
MNKDKIISQLKDKGYRITLARRLVVETILDSDSPLNPYEIAGIVDSKGKNVDVVTVYRIMEVLMELGLVHYLKGQKKYMICDHPCTKHCHHSFICDSCGGVDDLHIDDHRLLKQIAEKYAELAISGHYMELNGLCKKCK